MQFIDLAEQQKLIREDVDQRIKKVLDHGQYIMGPEIKELETALAKFAGVRYASACSSGTDALLLALMALDVWPGDEVFTTPFTFIATAEVAALLGLRVNFVDIDYDTFNIDTDKLEEAIKNSITPKAIIAVDLFGLPADYDNIKLIADKYDLKIIEDAAQSFGGTYRGQVAGSFGDIACTSFFPAKPLGCYGDGGMCFTNDPNLSYLIDSIKVHGQGVDKYNNDRIGINGRMDTIQAAILLSKFQIFPEELKKRQEVADKYTDLFSHTWVKTPVIPDGLTSSWAQYSVMFQKHDQREKVREKLSTEGIPSAIYYPKPLHLQKAFDELGYGIGDFPVSEICASKILSLPMHPYLKEEDQKRIVDVVLSIGFS